MPSLTRPFATMLRSSETSHSAPATDEVPVDFVRRVVGAWTVPPPETNTSSAESLSLSLSFSLRFVRPAARRPSPTKLLPPPAPPPKIPSALPFR